jgi:transcriptional regulator with XRE-family HTH domain
MDTKEAFLTALKHKAKEGGRGFQQSLSIESGLKDPYISNLVTGKKSNPSRGAMDRIAEALGITTEEMVSLGRSLCKEPKPLLSPAPSWEMKALVDSLQGQIRGLETIVTGQQKTIEAQRDSLTAAWAKINRMDEILWEAYLAQDFKPLGRLRDAG